MKEKSLQTPAEEISETGVPKEDNEEQLVNHNGFTQRPTLVQILPPLVLVLSAGEITSIALTMENLVIKLALLLVMYAIIVIMVYFWYIVTNIVPTDAVQIQHKHHIRNKTHFDTSKFKFYCNTCRTCVGNHSFHCSKCNRCVQLFDHHCKWLNNCIGAKNYFQFVALVALTEIYMLYNFALNIVFCVNFTQLLSWQMYLSAIWLVIDLIPLVALTGLLSLHVYLIVKKKSTIALIMQNRQKNKIHPSIINNHSVANQEGIINKHSLFRFSMLNDFKLSDTPNDVSDIMRQQKQRIIQLQKAPFKDVKNNEVKFKGIKDYQVFSQTSKAMENKMLNRTLSQEQVSAAIIQQCYKQNIPSFRQETLDIQSPERKIGNKKLRPINIGNVFETGQIQE